MLTIFGLFHRVRLTENDTVGSSCHFLSFPADSGRGTVGFLAHSALCTINIFSFIIGMQHTTLERKRYYDEHKTNPISRVAAARSAES